MSIIPIPIPIQIAPYILKFVSFPMELIQFAKENQIILPKINSLRGQALALMTQSEVRGQQYISRQEAVLFFQQIGMSSHDAIQPFNKSFGLGRMKLSRGQYCLIYPFTNDCVHLEKRKNLGIDKTNRDESIQKIKQWWQTHLIDIPNEEWHIGHLDPTIADSSASNLVFQPPIQARYRDRFKWDAYFFKMWPTAKELIKNFDKYYTLEEKRLLLETLHNQDFKDEKIET